MVVTVATVDRIVVGGRVVTVTTVAPTVVGTEVTRAVMGGAADVGTVCLSVWVPTTTSNTVDVGRSRGSVRTTVEPGVDGSSSETSSPQASTSTGTASAATAAAPIVIAPARTTGAAVATVVIDPATGDAKATSWGI